MAEIPTKRITLRMPKPVHDWLRRESFETRESINALIVKALENQMNQPGQPSQPVEGGKEQ